MKKLLKVLVQLLLGVVIGIVVAVVVITVLGGDAGEVTHAHPGKPRLLVVFGCMLVACGLSVVLQIAFHELGHLLLGLLTGYRFVSYRLFSLMITRNTDGRLSLKRFSLAGTLGQCIMEPPAVPFSQVPYFWYNAGGVVLNLLTAGLSLMVLRQSAPPMFAECLLIMLLLMGLLMAITNGVPMKLGGMANDGMNILSLLRYPELKADFALQMRVVARLNRGERYCELPAEWFAERQVGYDGQLIRTSSQLIRMSWLEDRGLLDDAKALCQTLLDHADSLSTAFQRELQAEMVLLELATTCQPDKVEPLWTKQLQAYVAATSKFNAARQAVLFARELLLDGDRQAAEQRLHDVRTHQDRYAIPGETRGAIDLMEHLLTKTINTRQ